MYKEHIMTYFSQKELEKIGFSSVGKEVHISTRCSIYAPHRINIGDNVRIDDFCLVSATGDAGRLDIGSHIHIATYVGLYAGAGIQIGDFCTISSKTTLYSTSDDYSGEYLIGPQIPEKYLKIDKRPITMEKYSAIGAHAFVMPGVFMGEGSVLGTMSLARNDLAPWYIYAGIPAEKLKERKKDLIAKASRVDDSFKK